MCLWSPFKATIVEIQLKKPESQPDIFPCAVSNAWLQLCSTHLMRYNLHLEKAFHECAPVQSMVISKYTFCLTHIHFANTELYFSRSNLYKNYF